MYSHLRADDKTTIVLCPTNDLCKRINDDMITRMEVATKTKARIYSAEDECMLGGHATRTRVMGRAAKKVARNETGGFEAELKLVIGAQVMLIMNLYRDDVKESLYNGLMGTVTAMGDKTITVKFPLIENEIEFGPSTTK